MRRLICLSLLVLFVSAVFSHAAETPLPPVPARWVTDTANFLSPETARSLDAQLEAYERSSGHQILVYIGKTTGGTPIDDWAVRAFAAWKVGRKGTDDGLVLFIMPEDQRLRFEVGYGLEGQVPDAAASRIINEIIIPRVQAGDRDGAVVAGIDAVVGVISGKGLSDVPAAGTRRRAPERVQPTMGQMIVFGIIGLLFLLLLMTNPSLAIYLIASILSGNRGGDYRGGGGGGGGFSGGGGRSGGGGASGSW